MRTIQEMPQLGGVKRVETGVVRFGDDWPGIFLRGKSAFGYANDLAAAVALLRAQMPEEGETLGEDGLHAYFTIGGLMAMETLLRSCDVTESPTALDLIAGASLPCPYCGGAAPIDHFQEEGVPESFHAFCDGPEPCGYEGPTCASYESAIEAHNMVAILPFRVRLLAARLRLESAGRDRASARRDAADRDFRTTMGLVENLRMALGDALRVMESVKGSGRVESEEGLTLGSACESAREALAKNDPATVEWKGTVAS